MMQKSDIEIIDQLAIEAYALSATFRRHGAVLAAKGGQTQARWQVLRAASMELLSVPQIARRLGVTRQNVQRITDELVADRLVQLVLNQDHKASPHLMLTQRGQETLEALTDAGVDYRKVIWPLVRHVDLVGLVAILKSVNHALGDVDVETEMKGGAKSSRRTGESKRIRKSS
ncbi:DNA-binding MarR family transcriptional regulator [Beijerinckia sp. GAS462]|nr:DNA-binding MarR family transcriptional regulator [Beijerinckia sp. GAS462]SEC36364.1 DNA-binding transcriptional regulator, MarR family [Beijerinckia sp. 28-YEA-48]